MATDQQMRVLASVTTPSLTVVGEIQLPMIETPGTSYHFRLLEMLNNPRLGMLLSGQQLGTVLLENATVIPEHGDVIQLSRRLHLRPEHITYVLEYDSARRGVPLQYNPKQYSKTEQLSILTSNGARIEGTFLGGAALLASGTTKRFVAVSQATVQDLRIPGAKLPTPFAILNHETIVAFSACDPAGHSRPAPEVHG